MIIGWIRPVVLMPAAAVMGLSLAQVDALVAHELAHLRRYDPIAHLLQIVAETMLFYHPAVWWISREVRQAREHCCDDLAIAVTGDRLTYVTALADLAACASDPQLVLGANGGSLRTRIARLLGAPQTPSWTSAIGSIVLMALIAVAGLTSVTASPGNLPPVNRPAGLRPMAQTPAPSRMEVAGVRESSGAAADARVLRQRDALGSIAGTVVDAVTGDPVTGVGVSFCSQWAYRDGDPERLVADRQVVTTTDGRFLFSEVPAGRYHICLTAGPKYLPDYSLRFYEVRPGEAVHDVVKQRVPLNSGVIDGRLVDERGQGVSGARLAKVRTWLQDGIPYLARAQDALSGEDGRFAFSVSEGRWAIVASSALRFAPQESVASESSSTGAPWNGFVEILNDPVARSRALAAQFLVDSLSAFPPSRPDRPIDFFSVAPGQSQRGLQVQLRPVPAYRISGRIVGSDVPVKNLRLALERADLPLARPSMPTAECLTDGTGRFAFLRVPAGRYRIRADTSPQAGPYGQIRISDRCDLQCVDSFSPTVWVDAPVEVRATVDDLAIAAHRGVSIRGSIRVEGPTPPTELVRNMMLRLEKVDGHETELPSISVTDGEFASVELPAGEYLIRQGPFGTPDGWIIKSAMVNGQDMTDVPLVIGTTPPGRVVVTIGPRNSSNLNGVVRAPDGQPDAAATVLLFSSDRKYWSHNTAGGFLSRTQIAMSSRLGAFAFRDVRPGEYLVVAVPDSSDALWPLASPDPDLFARWAPRATRVTVTEGSTTVQDLRTQR
jgi:hypothetical protein